MAPIITTAGNLNVVAAKLFAASINHALDLLPRKVTRSFRNSTEPGEAGPVEQAQDRLLLDPSRRRGEQALIVLARLFEE
jgi:hypothetical protein